ncbi:MULTISPECIES: TetR family transcriptional regulator [Ensifer]|jgi:AcrR family transcriptional regulator|uniref:TetR family transcriptional regulator n=1 Tax=Ensifer TaxID=106591 RepID=UPI00042E6C4B|nr:MULTISPECIES: TetR family transcriptional regulator [Ensifer]AHK45376.1 putative transcriptional regulator protein, TetR family [Ensifer adhaerens OV14]MDP9633544.1 AcrR family transcriptional regulator [Ensifer adhaerens]KQU89163.1 TetR family transcriptional regulator [Ensifer sp. Root31]KQY73319.1 TetR family transcriptional regulator [Ensifer sp. Root142]MBD9491024.1 TetR family transcriptional regulator [Ensifer sp. ENS11]
MDDSIDSQLDATRQENVSRILDAAERLFRHFGYSKTNVADIARDLGMSPANIYRFFASKAEIHQAICGRMLAASYQQALDICRQPLSATERLRQYIRAQHQMTVEVMLDDQKVHEMVVIAMERDWHVIDKHIDRLHALVADVIREGILAGEFPEQDADAASRCFGAATVILCHPQMVAQCLSKENRATPDELIEFAIKALKN